MLPTAIPSPPLYGRWTSNLNTLERQTDAASPTAVPPLEDPFCVIRKSRSGREVTPKFRGDISRSCERRPQILAKASDKSLKHSPAHAERGPKLLFKALVARLVLLKLPPRLPVNREHHTASPTRDSIGIFETQCVRQLIQQW